MGHSTYLRPKGTRDHSMSKKREQTEICKVESRKTRPVWLRLDCLKSNPVRDITRPTVMSRMTRSRSRTVQSHAAEIGRYVGKPERLETWPYSQGVGMNGQPNPDYQTYIGKSGLPTGREPYGNGAAVVVRTGESPVHGEGRQAVPWFSVEGREMRHIAEASDHEHGVWIPHGDNWRAGCRETGQSGSGRAAWKRARRRLPARAYELRHKPSTSPGFYFTKPR